MNKSPIFITEDGKKVFKLQTVLYGVDKHFNKRELVAGEYTTFDKIYYKWFSSEAARDGWIDWNMPAISLIQLKELGTLSSDHIISIPWPKLKGFITDNIAAKYDGDECNMDTGFSKEAEQAVPSLGIKAYYELAKRFMQEVMYDNGLVDRLNPEEYPMIHVSNIALSIGEFLEANESRVDELTSDDIINFISTGEENEVIEKYGSLEGFEKLHKALGDYFSDTNPFEK